MGHNGYLHLAENQAQAIHIDTAYIAMSACRIVNGIPVSVKFLIIMVGMSI